MKGGRPKSQHSRLKPPRMAQELKPSPGRIKPALVACHVEVTSHRKILGQQGPRRKGVSKQGPVST